MIRDGLLVLGLLLSTASQLRLPGIPLGLGPGELLLAGWIVVAAAELAAHRNPPITWAVSRLLLFWSVFAVAQCIGQIAGLTIEQVRDTNGAMRTAQAYALSAAVSCLAITDTAWRLRRVAWMLIVVGAFSSAVLIAGGYGVLPVPGIHFWVFHRFVGWSMNPNQFALLCTVLVLLSLHLSETATRSGGRLLALVCAVPPFVSGILTKSDSFILAMLLVGPMFLGVKLLYWAFFDSRRQTLRSMLASLMLFSTLAMLAAAAPFVPRIVQEAQESAIAMMEQNDQAEGRFNLWRDAVDVGLDAGMLGLGPGPHLVSKQWKLPPPEKNEAHNTLLDLFTQGGLLAAASFVWITATSFSAAYSARLIGLAALVLSLFVFSNFHLIVRHPTFWFTIALCLTAADAVRARSGSSLSARRGRRPDLSPPYPA